MSEKNKALAKRVIEEIFNGGNINNLEELVARDILIHDTDKELSGLDQLRQGIANLHAAFPDLHYTIEDLLADDDKVIVRCKGAGTHHGSLVAMLRRHSYHFKIFDTTHDKKLFW